MDNWVEQAKTITLAIMLQLRNILNQDSFSKFITINYLLHLKLKTWNLVLNIKNVKLPQKLYFCIAPTQSKLWQLLQQKYTYSDC